ncbi:MAG: FG-GAP-like repeat-containing protein, partial [Candidatus Neomarinimicrobiota bacterium]
LDASDNPRISYFDVTNSNLRYAYCDTSCGNPANWTTVTVDNTAWVGMETSLALDSSGNPRISYYDMTRHDLGYAYCDSSCGSAGNWTKLSVDAASLTGRYTSIKIDSNDRPHISYYDRTNENFKYAYYTGTGTESSCAGGSADWVCQTVNSAGSIGKWTSLDLDSNYNPHITYYDATNRDLVYSSGVFFLQVDSISPVQNAINVSKSSNIVIVFDETLNTGTVNQTNLPIWGSQSGLIDGTYSFSQTTLPDDTVTFNPDNDFKVGEKITTTVTPNVESTTGLNISNGYASEFFVEATAGTGKFSSVSYAFGGYSSDVGDLDNDGDIDFVSVIGVTAKVFLNNRSGIFTDINTYPLVNNAYICRLGDLDNDGDLDLVASNFNSSVISVLKNNGNGIFDPQITYSVGASPWGVNLGDFDSDGYLDLVAVNFSDGDVSVLMNNGNGTFGSRTDYSMGGKPREVIVADLNSDHSLDFAVSSQSGEMEVFMNNGNGTFASGVSYSSPGSSHQITHGDLDGDSDIDLVISNDTNKAAYVFLNNSDGTFASYVSYAVGTGGSDGINVGDLDSDGDLDFVISSHGGASIFLNDGSASFTKTLDISIGGSDGDVSIADFDGNNALDIISNRWGFIEILLADLPPQITIIQPNGGESVGSGSIYEIYWGAYDDSENLSIDLEVALDGVNFNPIPGASGLSNGLYYPYLLNWGGSGTGDGEFNRATGIDVDYNGDVYVVDNNNNRIQKFDSAGNFIGCLGGGVAGWQTPCLSYSWGSADGQFNEPLGLAVDNSNNIYVTEQDNSRIQKFDSDGNFLLKFGSYGSGDGQFRYVYDVDIDSNGNMYTVEFYNNRVQKFDSAGNFVGCIGGVVAGWQNPCVSFSQGSADGQFYISYAIAIDINGNIYVVDAGNHRVQKFDSSGNFLFKINATGPAGVSSDAFGNMFFTRRAYDLIHKYDSSGNSLASWYLNNPFDVIIDSAGLVY